MNRALRDLAPIPRKFGWTVQPLPARRSRLGSNLWLSLTFLGSAMVAISLVSYEIALSIAANSGIEQVGFLERAAYATLFVILVGLAVTFLGLTYVLKTVRLVEGSSSIIVTISTILCEKRSARIFALSALVYGFFFAVVSSTFVYQPGVTFSETYGAQVPSIVPVVCCGPIGQIPQFIIYVTQQFAILLIPVNVVLLFMVSWLVGLNASVAAFAYRNRPQTAGGRWMGWFGAVVGLFTACPTCAGFFLLMMLGLSSAISLALTLTSLQGLFILAGIPLLAVAPFLTIRKLSDCDLGTCLIPGGRGNLQKE